MQYKVVENSNLSMFESQVERLLSEKWELAGGIGTSYDRKWRTFNYTQALVKK